MNDYLLRLTVFLMSIILSTSCSKGNEEIFETTDFQLKSEYYLLPSGKRITLEYDIEKKEYLKTDDYFEFEKLFADSKDLVIANDGTDVLKIRKLDYYSDNFNSKKVSKNCCIFSRVRLYEGENFNGANITFNLNSNNTQYTTVSLNTRCVHGAVPVDNSCQVNLVEKVSSIELNDNSYAMLEYPNPNPRANNLRFYVFENPASLSNPDILKFKLSEINHHGIGGVANLNNKFRAVIKVRFFAN